MHQAGGGRPGGSGPQHCDTFTNAKDKRLERPGLMAGLQWQKVSVPLSTRSCGASGIPKTWAVMEAICILLIFHW